ncbi:unnamed protein product, partial [Polarella glacialis]
ASLRQRQCAASEEASRPDARRLCRVPAESEARQCSCRALCGPPQPKTGGCGWRHRFVSASVLHLKKLPDLMLGDFAVFQQNQKPGNAAAGDDPTTSCIP